MSENKKEMVNHPQHYQGNKFEVIDVIEDYNLGFNLGNSIKYILRCEKKHRKTEDLKKAIWYIEREIKNTETKRENDIKNAPYIVQTKENSLDNLYDDENKNCCIKKCFSCGKEFRSDNARDLICPRCYNEYVGE